MNFATLQQEVREWADRNFDTTDHWDALMGVVEEVGELAHAELKMKQGIRGVSLDHLVARNDAVGDIMVYLADYCGRAEIDMDAVVTATWNQVKERDWKKHQKDGTTQ